MINQGGFKGEIAGFSSYRFTHIFEEHLRHISSKSYYFYHLSKSKDYVRGFQRGFKEILRGFQGGTFGISQG